ncbi:hypothetical protein GRI97_02895 [Altererythrobacter xixiisoli]|uniref:Coenzyme F390 synthetase n=1 Tax=Croceibacterium xixiisoli TaxID=1476466 RepID=A0A6I4TQ13_9SPHN|nr:hypothetical protein [Croceibacterium xixiisoli]MXO97936.1 hypothetical protein [Croceibacterium xixiisoli]
MGTERILASWWRTRRAMRLSPTRLQRHRQQQWRALQPALRRTPALQAHAGGRLEDVPIVDVAEIRRDYGQWNSLGLTEAQIRQMADHPRPSDIAVGYSSGTAGQRGLFIADAAERADYIGQSLARLLPLAALMKRQRLALHLRSNSALYSDVSRGRFAFAHFPLDHAADQTWVALQAWRPTILIAPPHRLLAMAHAAKGPLPTLHHLFYGSEPMSRAEADWVESHFRLRPRSIYQATEGFLGAACPQGALHLNDHSLDIELSPVDGTPGFRPIITDLRRHSQPIVRVRGDDYLELADQTCPCGFAGRVIAPPMGRVQQIWRYPGRVITPGQVIDTMDALVGPQTRWRAVAGREGVTLHFHADHDRDHADLAAEQLRARLGLPVPVQPAHDFIPDTGPKRSRVEWRNG